MPLLTFVILYLGYFAYITYIDTIKGGSITGYVNMIVAFVLTLITIAAFTPFVALYTWLTGAA